MQKIGRTSAADALVAHKAKELFVRADMDACIDQLLALLSANALDLRIMHNLLIARHKRSALPPKELYSELSSLFSTFTTEHKEETIEEYFHEDPTLLYNFALISHTVGDFSTSQRIFTFLLGNLDMLFPSLACKTLISCFELFPNREDVQYAVKANSLTLKGDPVDAFALHVMMGRLGLFSGNWESASAEITSAMNLLKDNSDGYKENFEASAMYLKAHLEFLKGNPARTLQLVNSSQSALGVGSVEYFNNLAIVHLFQGKLGLSHFYFTKALERIENASVSVKSDLYYNLGLLLLKEDDPFLALECFKVSSTVRFDDWRIWLRMAECCILRRTQLMEELESENLNSMVYKEERSFHGIKYYFSTSGKVCTEEELDMHAAEMFLMNSLIVSDEEACVVIWISLAFVYLCLEKPREAIEVSQKVIQSSRKSMEQLNIARIYLSEALSMLGMSSTALESLEHTENPFPFTSHEWDTQRAVLMALSGDDTSAVSQLQSLPSSATKLRLELYLSLKNRTIQETISILENRIVP